MGDKPVHQLMLHIQHRLNPLHVHCRLVEKGLAKRSSALLCKWYGILVYSWVVRLTIMAVWISRQVKQEAQRTNAQRPTP